MSCCDSTPVTTGMKAVCKSAGIPGYSITLCTQGSPCGAGSCPTSAHSPCTCRGPRETERRARLSALWVLGVPARAHTPRKEEEGNRPSALSAVPILWMMTRHPSQAVAGGTHKFPGQGLNPCCIRDRSHCSDDAGSLSRCAAREPSVQLF